MNTLALSWALAGALALLALVAILRAPGKRRQKKARALESAWPDGPGTAPDRDALDDIARYYREKRQVAPGACPVDDITWNDLDMDQVFAQLRCESCVGEDVLYDMLRDTGADGQALEKRSRMADAIRVDPELRSQVRMALHALGRDRYHGAAGYLFHPGRKHPAYWGAYAALAALPVAFFALGFVNPAFFLGIAAMFLVNAVVYYRSGKVWMAQIAAVRHIAAVLGAAGRMEQALRAQFPHEAAVLGAVCQEMKPVKRWNALFALQRVNDLDFLTEYLRIMFQLDMLCLARLAAFFDRHNAGLRELYHLVGEIDACVALAAYRHSHATCRPAFVEGVRVEAEGLCHPLIEDPVDNGFSLENNLLITGSNASGKSTFIKSVAIAAIMAQCLNTVRARSFALCRAQVISSMALRDNLSGGESYFIVEIKSLKRILDALHGARPVLCFIDEILRGTNTKERIAASTSLLAYLEGKNCLCLAATHDQELVKLLPGYRQAHFREQLTHGGMTFSYKLMDGPSDTRNAIALLRQMQFPKEIVERAEAMA